MCYFFCMIQNGDLFTVKDLKESVRWIADMRCPGCAELPAQYADRRIELYADIKSSAVNLDDSLRQAGFKTTYRFAYDYNIPGLTYDEIVKDAYKLEYFYTVACQYLQQTNSFPKAFVFDAAARLSYYYAQYIWVANPSARFDYAKKLDLYYDWGRVLCFLLGVGFRFHPRDVYEFVMNFNNPSLGRKEMQLARQKQQVFKDWCAEHSVDTGCLVLCDAHQEKLRKIIGKTDTPYFFQVLLRPFYSR